MYTHYKRHHKTYKKALAKSAKKKLKKFLPISFLVLLIIGGGVYLFFFSSILKVKEIEVLGNEKISRGDILDITWQKIFRKIFFFSSENIFLLNLQSARGEILKKLPQIFEVSFRREFPSKLIVEIEERKAVGIFFAREEPFFVDGEGVIFEYWREEALGNSDSQILVIKSEKTDLNLGDKAVDREIVEKILKINKALDVLKIGTKEFFLPSTSSGQVPSPVRLDVKTNEGFGIYFSLIDNLDWQITKLKLALEKEIPSERREQLEYIDLRFENMVYPKWTPF